MQLAERWLGGCGLAVFSFSLSLLAVVPHGSSAKLEPPAPQLSDDEMVASPDLAASNTEAIGCDGTRTPDTYDRVFACARAELLTCVQGRGVSLDVVGDVHVDLMIVVAADGRVTRAEVGRGTRETPISRCLVSKIEELRFPRADSSVAIMAPIAVRAF